MTEHAVGGPGRWPRQSPARDGPHPIRIGAEQPEDLTSETDHLDPDAYPHRPRPPLGTRKLRLRIFSAARRIVRGSRRGRLRIAARWPWADQITAGIAANWSMPPGPGTGDLAELGHLPGISTDLLRILRQAEDAEEWHAEVTYPGRDQAQAVAYR